MTGSTLPRRRPRILVIEDDREMLTILRVNLEASGFPVIGATDGLTGLHAFETEKPDLVILDIQLPKISGFRLLELFRRGNGERIPVMALTAMDFVEAEELTDYGVDGFITKPFKPEELISMVGYLLGCKTPSTIYNALREDEDAHGG